MRRERTSLAQEHLRCVAVEEYMTWLSIRMIVIRGQISPWEKKYRRFCFAGAKSPVHHMCPQSPKVILARRLLTSSRQHHPYVFRNALGRMLTLPFSCSFYSRLCRLNQRLTFPAFLTANDLLSSRSCRLAARSICPHDFGRSGQHGRR